MKKTNHNDPCPCGSHKKYKHCCGSKTSTTATSLPPSQLSILIDLKNAVEHHQAGRLDLAEAVYQRVLHSTPQQADALHLLGLLNHQRGNNQTAVELISQAIQAKPSEPIFYSNLGNALYALGKLEQAATWQLQSLQMQPNNAEFYINLGTTLQAQGKLPEAVACYQKALQLQPDFAPAYRNLALALMVSGKHNDAVRCYRQALSIQPDDAQTYSDLLITMQYMETLSPEQVFKEHQHYAERFETPQKQFWKSHRNQRDPDRRLKIGYVSGDFREHAVAFFIEPILANHNKAQVEIYCYYTHIQHDAHTDRIATYADHWLPCAGISDDELAERIRADGIDILVDLSGHTAHNRLPVFARKPAPVQATWIGYAGTTGLTAMDYRITETYLDPPGLTERYHSETLIRLPDNTGAAYEPVPGCPPVNPLPALTSGEFVFASLNNLNKINPSVISLWGKILTALPHAKLMLGNVTENSLQQMLTAKFNEVGITAERLILQPRVSTIEYLALHNQIDMALDTFPYNGGTTTHHSLWMGVPVITLAGDHTSSRSGIAILSSTGLSQFIASNEEEYLQLSMRFAQDLPGLNRIRQSLREQANATTRTPSNITRHLEDVYRNIWRQWCSTQEKLPA
jgi:predicted O-linked N-acetylglucosamine transferase (SPINDLY family)